MVKSNIFAFFLVRLTNFEEFCLICNPEKHKNASIDSIYNLKP